MKNKILKIYNNYGPKLFSRFVKKNNVLWAWVILHSDPLTHELTITEIIYSALYSEKKQCINNSLKKFKNFKDGYGGCGRTSVCECLKKQVSYKVKQCKANMSEDAIKKANKKRIITNLKKYGVINTGQITKAKKAHKKYYSDNFIKKPEKDNKGLLWNSYHKLNVKYNKIDIEFITSAIDYIGVSNQTYYKFKCLKCDNIFEDYIDNGKSPICRNCHPYKPSYISNQEQEVFNFVSNITIDAYQSDKSIINPYELDIVVPSKQIAIEYCGLYWHSEFSSGKSRTYHKNKMTLAESQGYRLITIFEDEWCLNRNIVESRLKNIFGCSEKIFARNTTVREINSPESKVFCNKYHIQKSTGAKIHMGCFYDDELISVMTFGKPRYNKQYEYELLRYCSKNTVVGGASKIFKYFVKTYSPSNIISYCDLRWGTGDLYEKLDFSYLSTTTPGYSYTDYIKRCHRSNFTKKKLIEDGFDSNLTERQIMKARKYDIIWDCGNNVYGWDNNEIKKGPKPL